MHSIKSIISSKIKAIKSGNIKDFDYAEKIELDIITNGESFKFTQDSNNDVVKSELKYQKLCRTLEIEGIENKNLTVLEFNSAIDLIIDKYKKQKNK